MNEFFGNRPRVRGWNETPGCLDFLVWAQLRGRDTDASAGMCEALEKIVPAICVPFPKAKSVVRAYFGFSREEILARCES